MKENIEIEAIRLAVDVGKKVWIHATGSPAQIVAVGTAAGVAAVATGIGYGLYLGAAKLYNLLSSE